jgi:chromosome segregation ATPase
MSNEPENKNEETDEEEESVWGLIKAFFSAISLKTKLILGIIASIFGAIAFFIMNRNRNDREILEFELKKVREEIEIEQVQIKIDGNTQRLEILKKRADEIVNEITELEEQEEQLPDDKDASNDEIDKFFDDRGF